MCQLETFKNNQQTYEYFGIEIIGLKTLLAFLSRLMYLVRPLARLLLRAALFDPKHFLPINLGFPCNQIVFDSINRA